MGLADYNYFTTTNINTTGSATNSSITYWPVSNTSGITFDTITVSGTNPGYHPDVKIPDLQESEVGRLRRRVAEMCAEGRVALEAA